jgi:hypothetical protein
MRLLTAGRKALFSIDDAKKCLWESGRASNPVSECEAADQRHDKQNEEYEKEDSGDARSRESDTPETKDRRDNRNHQKHGRPPEHKSSIGVGIGTAFCRGRRFENEPPLAVTLLRIPSTSHTGNRRFL